MTKYIEIRNIIAEEIDSGKYKSGAVLPTEKELMSKYGVSMTTIKKALKVLQQKGYIIRRQGSGTYVKDSVPSLSSRIPNIGVLINLNEQNSEQSFLAKVSNSRLWDGIKKALTSKNVNITMAIYHDDNPEPWKEIESGLKIDVFLDMGLTVSDRLADFFVSSTAKVISILNSASIHRYKHNFPCVLIDFLSGLRDAVKYYAGHGFKRFGYIGLAESGLMNFRDFEEVLKQENLAFDMESVLIHPERTTNLNNFQRRIEQIGRQIINNKIRPDVFFFDGSLVADALISYFAREQTGLKHEIRYCVIENPATEMFQSGGRPDFIVPALEDAGYKTGNLLLQYIEKNKVENLNKVASAFVASN